MLFFRRGTACHPSVTLPTNMGDHVSQYTYTYNHYHVDDSRLPPIPKTLENYLNDSNLSHFSYGDSLYLAARQTHLRHAINATTMVLDQPGCPEDTGQQYRSSDMAHRSLLENHTRSMSMNVGLIQAALIDSITQWLLEWLGKWATSEAFDGGSSHSPTSYKGTGRIRARSSKRSSSSGSRRPTRGAKNMGSGRDDDDQDADETAKNSPAPGARRESRRFACPFFKRRPGMFLACSGVEYFDVTRLKA